METRGRSRERTRSSSSRDTSVSHRSRSHSRERVSGSSAAAAAPAEPCTEEEHEEEEEDACVICFDAFGASTKHRMQCCGKELCHSCTCTVFIRDEGKCPFCGQLFASSPTSIVVTFYRLSCTQCSGPVWYFDKTCRQRSCPNSKRPSPGSIAPGSTRRYAIRRYYDIFEIKNVQSDEEDGKKVSLDRCVLFSHDHGPTLGTREYILHKNGKISHVFSTNGRSMSWQAGRDPLWFPLMASSLAQCPFIKA